MRPDASSASTPRHRGGASPALPSKNESEGRGRAETPFTVAQVLLARNKSARVQEGSLPIPAPGPSFSAAPSYPAPGLSPSSGTPPTHIMPASTAPEPRSLCVCVCVYPGLCVSVFVCVWLSLSQALSPFRFLCICVSGLFVSVFVFVVLSLSGSLSDTRTHAYRNVQRLRCASGFRVEGLDKVAVHQWLFPPTHYTLNHNPEP